MPTSRTRRGVLARRWFVFDNATGQTTDGRRDLVAFHDASMRPAGLPARAGVYVKVQLRSAGAMNPAWEKPVDAYFRMVRRRMAADRLRETSQCVAAAFPVCWPS